MDASTSAAVGEVQCDVCGYPRTGLTGGALCPECGEPPPVVATPASGRRRLPVERPDAMTAGKLAHARAVALGLLLLVLTSASALSVTLIMDLGPLTIPALNAPAPKLHAAALVQRSIGGRPGPWGVSGTLAALGAILGIWLITTPRSLTADEEPAVSLRKLARYSAIVGVGGALGLLLSGADWYLDVRGQRIGAWVAAMVLCCELPANGLLYAYLRRLSGEFGARRSSAALAACAWGVPVVTAAAGVIIVYAAVQQAARHGSVWPLPARVGAAVYSAAALGVGAAATAGVLRLLWATAGAAFGGWVERVTLVLGRLPRGIRGVVDAVRRDPARWAVLAGILLWAYQYRDVAMATLELPTRDGTWGRVPMLDFPGPKVPIALLAGGAAQRYSWLFNGVYFNFPMLILGAVWLMTWPDVPNVRRESALRIRRAILLLCVLALGVGVLRQALLPGMVRHPRVVAFIVTGLSVVATGLVYLRLAAVASSRGLPDVARRLAVLGVIAAALDLVPLGAFKFNPHGRNLSMGLGLICAAQVGVVFLVTFGCLGALLRLAWDLAMRDTQAQDGTRHDARPRLEFVVGSSGADTRGYAGLRTS